MSETPEVTPAPEATPEPQATQPPPWGTPEEFNPEKAWNLIQNLKADKERLSARKALTPDDERRLSEYARLEEASQTELERAQKAAEAAANRIKSITDRAVGAEVKALAAGKFADPSDALAFLGDTSKYVGEGDQIDTESIVADLNALLERKPHLAPPQESKLPRPNPAQGANGSTPETGAPQLTAEQVSQLYREKKFDEIAQAQKEGRLNNLLGAQS